MACIMVLVILIWIIEEGRYYAFSNISIFTPTLGVLIAVFTMASLAFFLDIQSDDGDSIFRPDVAGWPTWIALMVFPVGLGLGIIFAFVVFTAYLGGSHGFFETLAFRTGFFGPLLIALGTGVITSLLAFIPLQLLAWIFSGFLSNNHD